MPRRRGLSYAERVPPLQTTPETFWLGLFRFELALIRNSAQRALVHRFLRDLRIMPMELEPGLIQGVIRHHLHQLTPRQSEIVKMTFQNWATLPLCQPPSSDSASSRAPGFARSPRARTRAG